MLGSTLSPATCDSPVLRVVFARVDDKRFVCLSRSTPSLVEEYTNRRPLLRDYPYFYRLVPLPVILAGAFLAYVELVAVRLYPRPDTSAKSEQAD